MSELFPIASITKLTPRAAWMKKYGLDTFTAWDEWNDKDMWYCWNPIKNDITDDDDIGIGETEHDAICEWAIKNNVRLWNEEQK